LHPPAATDDLILKQLDKILSSAGFMRNDRLSRFLRFVVTQQLEGKADELKESLVGIEVFGRAPGFDSKLDSVVRTEAAKLRARLAEYYAGEGAGDAVLIQLPKGGYAPVVRQVAHEIAATTQDATPPRSRRRPWLLAAFAAVAIAFGTFGLWRFGRQTPPIPIAVLPLINLDRNPDHDYFADGLTSEIIRNLSIIDGLAVRSQTSSFAFKGKQQNIRAAGKQLHAEYILEGSVFRSGQQLRINARLVRVRDDFPLWTGSYDEELTDVFAIQEKISRGIVNGLRLNLGQGRRRYETGTEAYDLYLRARALQIQHGEPGLDQSIGPLEEAIAKDPSFAPAYASLATAYAIRSGQFRQHIPDEVRKLRAAVEQAIRLDPLLGDAHAALGMLHARDARWVESEKSFRRAIELDPNSSASHTGFAYILRCLGRVKEALDQLRIVEKNDPLSPQLQFMLGWTLIQAGRYDEAARYCNKLPADYQTRSTCLGRALLWQGRTEEAIQIFIKSGVPWDRASLGYAYARSGRREEAEKLAIDISRSSLQNPVVIFAGLGDKDRALEALDRMTAGGPVRMGSILSLPELALLRGDPRLKALRKRVGLPE
jgi:TolB-like protein/Flp pilus assembly protein TadD